MSRYRCQVALRSSLPVRASESRSTKRKRPNTPGSLKVLMNSFHKDGSVCGLINSAVWFQ